MAIQAAQLVVSLTAQGAQQTEGAINRVSGAVDKAAGGFDAFFESIKGGAGSALRALDGISKAMGAIAVMGGITLLAGGAKAAWTQVDAVQQATVALRAYETDARKVDAVLKDLLAFARSDQGKLFMRQELFHAAQAMKVAGAETENLARYTEILSRSVSSGMGTWNELERVISRVGSTGRITGEDFEMLQKMGFQLDASLRNTTTTWEELFDVLDRASVKVEGQSETIQGRMMTLQTAIRGVGLAFLDIDSETSMFREGGLGDRIMSGLEHAPALMASVASAAGQLGNAIVGVIDFVTNMVNAFRMLPDPIQNVVATLLKLMAAFGAIRVAGRAMGLVTSMMGLGGMAGGIGTLMGGGGLFRGGTAGAAGFGASLASLVARINPVGLAITALVGVGGLLINNFMENKAATEAWEGSLSSLNDQLEKLRRTGDADLAGRVEGIMTGMPGQADRFQPLDHAAYQRQRILQQYGPEMLPAWDEGRWFPPRDVIDGWNRDWGAAMDVWDNVRSRFADGSAEMTALNAKMTDAISDPNIDINAWLDFVDATLAGANSAEELDAALQLILDTPLSDFAKDAANGMGELDESMKRVGATTADIAEMFEDLPKLVDDLRSDGLYKQAAQIEDMGRVWQQAFTPKMLPGAGGEYTLIDDLDAMLKPELAANLERINTALASGDYDNAKLLADVMTVLGDPNLTLDQKAHEIDAISESLSTYVNLASRVLEVTGRGGLTSMLDLAGLGGDAVAAAANVNELSASMDTLYRVIIGNTNAIGQQSEALVTWAEDLIKAEGEFSKLDELVNSGRITGTSGVFDDGSEYANAQQAYNDILAANADIQEHILVIQAKQAPLLAANAVAMEEYMGAIADMPVDEQLAALGFMDQGLQQQLGTVIELGAQMKQLGPEGEASFRQMAEGIAMSNPALFSMMESIGLVTDVVRDADGTVVSFEINLDGATTVQDSINSLIESIDALTLALGGVPPLRVEADTAGAEDAITRTKWAADDFDGSTSMGILDADGSPAIGQIGTVDESLDAINGQTATVNVVANDQATSVLSSIAANWGGVIATSWIDVVTRNVGGNIPGRATGGYVNEDMTLVGEMGPELVSLPRGSYVHTNADSVRMANAGKGGNNDNSITVNLNGATFHNTSREEMNAWAEQDLIPGISRAVADRRTGMGAA